MFTGLGEGWGLYELAVGRHLGGVSGASALNRNWGRITAPGRSLQRLVGWAGLMTIVSLFFFRVGGPKFFEGRIQTIPKGFRVPCGQDDRFATDDLHA